MSGRARVDEGGGQPRRADVLVSQPGQAIPPARPAARPRSGSSLAKSRSRSCSRYRIRPVASTPAMSASAASTSCSSSSLGVVGVRLRAPRPGSTPGSRRRAGPACGRRAAPPRRRPSITEGERCADLQIPSFQQIQPSALIGQPCREPGDLPGRPGHQPGPGDAQRERQVPAQPGDLADRLRLGLPRGLADDGRQQLGRLAGWHQVRGGRRSRRPARPAGTCS